VLDQARARDADQHVRLIRGAEGKWRLAAQAPQPEVLAIEEPLALDRLAVGQFEVRSRGTTESQPN
jgi:hypothetical protein